MGKSYTRFDNLEVTGEIKLPLKEDNLVTSPDAEEAAGSAPTKAEFDAVVALACELKEKLNGLITGFGGPEPAPTPERAPEIKETLIKEPKEDAPEIRETEPVILDARKDTEPEEDSEPETDAEEPETDAEEPEPDAEEPETDAEEPETGDPDEKPDTEAQEAEEPEPEEEQAEAEAEAGEATGDEAPGDDATGDEAPEDLN